MPLPDTPYILSANAWEFITSSNYADMRSKLLNSGTLATDAPITISQTWNDLPTAFTAFKVNATSTNSAAASKLLDLQLGGASKAYVDKNGAIYGTGVVSGVTFKTWVNASQVYNVDLVGVGLIFAGYPGQFFLPASSFMGWNSNDVGSGSVDTKLFRDSASGNTLALRNGTAAQTFNVYGTSSASNANYARLALTCGLDGNATISTQALGTGTAGTVSINGISASANGNLLNFAGSNGSILSQNNYINLQSNAYAAVQVTGARGAGNEPSSTAIYYGPPSGTIDATSAFKIYRRTGGVDSVPFMVNSAGNVGIGTTSPTSKLHVAGTIKPEQATITTNATTAILLDISHAGTVLTTSNASNVTITLPAAGTVGVGYNVMIIQGGAGTITVQSGVGNTLNSFGSLYSSAGLHAAICIVCTAANTYNISGNLA